MPLSELISYEHFPELEADNLSPEDIPALEGWLATSIRPLQGSPILLRPQPLPAWYFLLLYRRLFPHVPEIAIEAAAQCWPVIHTTFPKKGFVRPEAAWLLPETGMQGTALTQEHLLDLGRIPPLDPEDPRQTVSWLGSHAVPTGTLILTGDAEPATALVGYVLLRSSAERVIYSEGRQQIIL